MQRDTEDSTANAEKRRKTIRLSLPDMNCPWTARRISAALQRVDGVVETSLEPRLDTVVARYDPTLTSAAAITAFVERPGSASHRESTGAGRRSGGCGCRGGPT